MMVFFAILGPIANKMPQAEMIQTKAVIPAIMVYFVLGGAFLWLGIGSIRARRWAWALTVVMSWLWLILGVLSFLSFLFMSNSIMTASIEQQGQVKLPPEAILMMQVISGIMTFGIYVLLPAAFLIFYQRKSVLMTCQRKDPQIRWTDRCPLPVLAISIILAFSALSIFLTIFIYGGTVPIFGHLISGAIGSVSLAFVALIVIYLAWGTYRLQIAAWWGTLLLWIVGMTNTVLMFIQVDLIEMYEKMGMPKAQIELMQKSNLIELASRWGLGITLLSGAIFLGYLFYIYRYFTHKPEEESIGT